MTISWNEKESMGGEFELYGSNICVLIKSTNLYNTYAREYAMTQSIDPLPNLSPTYFNAYLTLL